MPDAGWYQDPQEPQRLRWWDGQRWGAHAPQQTVAAPVTAAQPQYPWMQQQPQQPQPVVQQGYPTDRPMTQTPTWGFSVPPVGTGAVPLPVCVEQPTRFGSAARERAIRAANPVAYAAMLVTVLSFLFDPFAGGLVAGIVLGVIGIVRARRLVGVRFTGLGMSITAVVVSGLRLLLFVWAIVRALH